VGVPWRGVAVLLVVLLALGSPRLVATAVGRRRWSRASSSAALAEAAWAELRTGLGDLGVRWAVSWTPRAVERRLIHDYHLEADTQAALHRLTAEIEAARYAPPDDELGRTAAERRSDASAVISAVAATLPGRQQWLVRVWPRSGLATLGRIGPAFNAAADRAGRQASTLGSQVRDRVGGRR
jgi:hypothetical protein